MPMTTTIKNILFICTGNSCRSIMAEAILARLGGGRYCAYSAGSHPAGVVNPNTLELLAAKGHDIAGFSSKSWDGFTNPGAVEMDLIITVCDNAAGETCPIWLGHPENAHWPFPDPAVFRGSADEIRAHYAQIYERIDARIQKFLDDVEDIEDAG